MAMAASNIEQLIKAALPDAEVTITDLVGDGDHYAARVVSSRFAGLSRIRQHQLVYAALGGRMGGSFTRCSYRPRCPIWRKPSDRRQRPHRRTRQSQ